MRVFGNPPHTRAFLLFDGTTRALLALMDYGVLNSLRVGASAGLAAKYLAPKEARVVGLLGSGWQAPPQAYALKAALPNLQRIRVYSPTAEHRLSFALSMARLLEIEVEAASSAEAALRDADVVDLCAPGHFDVRDPLFDAQWIKPGALVISMAANQYPPSFGQHAAHVDTEALSSVVARGRAESEKQTIIYHIEGGTVHDLFVARWGYEWARARGLGTPFDLSA
jgi:ornithine cyclodeaminase/alanine dehydrogenase-like protein (mu-crystallin family)